MLDPINKDVALQMHSLAQRFRNSQPYPHVIVDDFFVDDFARKLLDDFPAFDEQKAKNELGVVGGKATNENIRSLGKNYEQLDDLVKSEEFLGFLSIVTGIPDLLYDPEYVGGGTHENLHGQDLDPHVDFNYHPKRKWHRRLNMIIYLNTQWEEHWGGSFELHSNPSEPDQNEVQFVLPLMNRGVLFETSERSWHGFKQICLPHDKKSLSRKSIALYFYTKQRPENEVLPEHGTIYFQRPLPTHITAGYTLNQFDVDELRALLARRDDWLKFLYQRELEYSAQLGLKNTYINELSAKIGKSWRSLLSRSFLRG